MGRHDSSSEEEERYRKRDRRRRQKHKDKRSKKDVSKPNVPELNDNNGKALGKTGGVYIPPFKKERMIMKEVKDKSSVEYQRLTWDALRKSINGLVNKVNARNIKNIVPELFAVNLIRGRGLFCRSCIKSQMASPEYTDVFAALVAVVNSKFPQVGLLLLKRVVLQLMKAYTRNDKPQVLAAVKFIAHLVNQLVAEETMALELVTLLLEDPTDDSVELAVVLVKECGARLQDFAPKGLNGIFERFRSILHDGEIDKSVQYLIEGLYFAKFPGHHAVRSELDLAEEKYSHYISLEKVIDPETVLDVFKPDPDFLENEKKYVAFKNELLAKEEIGYDASSEEEDDEFDENELGDEAETNLVNLRRKIYQTIMASIDLEQARHKLLKLKLEPGQEMELCIILLECCGQERTYLRYYSSLGQLICMISKSYQENFEKCFVQLYSMIHCIETNDLPNVAKFFAHLLATEAISLRVFSYIRLTKEDTTSSSRIFLKFLFGELWKQLGIRLLNKMLQVLTMQDSLESIFPRDNQENMRLLISFFTSIGLSGITEHLKEYMKYMQHLINMQQQSDSESDDSSSSGSESGSSSSGSNSDSSSSDSESESDREKRKRRRRG
ncbi:pre-mRNA-splicing factor CWC22 homolog [Capsella rubella]|nr:pre-mRNA-splicing factor CWC22 homolog [Capsella rubella]